MTNRKDSEARNTNNHRNSSSDSQKLALLSVTLSFTQVETESVQQLTAAGMMRKSSISNFPENWRHPDARTLKARTVKTGNKTPIAVMLPLLT